MDEIFYKRWRIEVLHADKGGWKALIYAPHSLIPEKKVPSGTDRHDIIAEAVRLVDLALGTP